MKRGRIVSGLLFALLVASIGANLFLFRQGQTFFRDQNAIRLDPIGLAVYPPDADPPPASSGQHRVLLFGDSRAAMWGKPTWGSAEVLNRGIGYQTTAQILERLERQVKPLHPSVVVLEAGVNDLKTIPLFPERRAAIVQTCTENLETIITHLKGLGSTVVFCTIFPIADVPLTRRPFWSDDVDKAVVEVNDALRAWSAHTDHLIVFDAYKELLDERGKTDRKYAFDMLHLNAAGYAALDAKLVPVVTAATLAQ